MDKALLKHFKPDMIILTIYFLSSVTCLMIYGRDLFEIPYTKQTPFFANEIYLTTVEA
jgi:hypothetical protein